MDERSKKIDMQLNGISLKENTCNSYIDWTKQNSSPDGWDILPDTPQLITNCTEKDTTGATIKNFLVQKTYSLSGAYTDGLICVYHTKFECHDGEFKYCGVNSQVQLIRINGKGDHTISNTKFNFCGIKGDFKEASIIELGGDYAIENVLSNLTFSHDYQKENEEERSYLFKCYRAIKCDGDVPISIYDSTFYNSSCDESGSSIRFETSQEIKVTRCDFQKYGTHDHGGSIFILIKNSFTIDDCKFIDITQSPPFGGAIYANLDHQIRDLKTIIIQNCYFEKNYAGIQGSAIYLDFGQSDSNLMTKIKNNEIQNCGGCDSIMYIQHRVEIYFPIFKDDVEIIGNHIFNNHFAIVFYLNDNVIANLKIDGNIIENVTNEGKSIMKFENRKLENALFENNIFRNIQINSKNVFKFLAIGDHININVHWTNCSFLNINNGNEFGALVSMYEMSDQYITQIFRQCKFEHNRAVSKGGALYVDQPKPVSIIECQFIDNEADMSGSIYIKQATTVDIQLCTFINNHAKSGHSIAIHSNPAKLKIESCIIENEKGGLLVDFSGQTSIEILNTTFDNSTLIIKQTNQNTMVTVNNCTFTNITEQSSLCFDLSIQSTSFTFDNNIIQNLISKPNNEYFGIINAEKVASFKIEGMKFINNACNFLYGGGFGIQFKSITDLSFIGCDFINNKAEQDRTTNRMPSGSGYEYFNGDGGGIQIGFSDTINSQISKLTFEFCTFEGNKAYRHGGGIAVQGVGEVRITGCNFTSNSANHREESGSELLYSNHYELKEEGRGGAIYINPTYCPSSKDCDSFDKLTSSVTIDNCSFVSNEAYDGYAIYIEGEDPQITFTIEFNNFTNNFNKRRRDSAIIASEICIFTEEGMKAKNEFINIENGAEVEVLIVSCVDRRGKLIPSREFTLSKEFSKSDLFTQTDKFSTSGKFTRSFYFSETTDFSESAKFSYSSKFSKSDLFSKTDKFSISTKFTESQEFSNTKGFTSTMQFSYSQKFSESKGFSETDKFTQTFYFSESKKFTNTQRFTGSKDFTNSNYFTETEFFSKSFEFTSSIQPTPYGGNDCLVSSDEGNYTIHPCYMTNADDRSVVVYVLLSNFTDFIEKESGASIRITNGGFECINATFSHCVSTEGGGGAICIKNKLEVSNDINLQALHFTKCQALYGGAVYLYCSSSNRNVNITSCTFTQNSISGSKSDPLFGGFHLFVTAKTLNVQNSTFHKGTGNHKGGSVKIYNVFDDDDIKQAKKLNENKNFIFISGCNFDLDRRSKSSLSFVDIQDSTQISVSECSFSGKPTTDSQYISGKVRTSIHNIKVESCKFETDNDFLNNMKIESIKDSVFDTTKRNHFTIIPNYLLMIAFCVSIFIILIISIILKRTETRIEY